MDSELLKKIAKLFPSALTDRQRIFLAYQLLGYSQAEIAKELPISVQTVELVLANARETMGIEKTRDAFVIALGNLP